MHSTSHASFFGTTYVEFVMRKTNEVAQTLTNVTIFNPYFYIWVEISYYIEHIIINEMQ